MNNRSPKGGNAAPKRTSEHELRLTLKKLFAKRRVRATVGLGLAAAVALGISGVGQTVPTEPNPMSTTTTRPASIGTSDSPPITGVEPDGSTSRGTTDPDRLCAAMASDNDEQVDIRLQVTHDEYVSGLIERAVDGIGTTESVDGALGNSQFHLVITAPDGSERLARWWYDNRGIELDDGTFVPFVGCDGEDSQ